MLNFIFVSMMLLSSITYALDVKILANNKESQSRQMRKSEVREAKNWEANHRLGTELKIASAQALQETLNSFLTRSNYCDLGFKDLFQQKTIQKGIIFPNDQMYHFFKYLRSENVIDDIFYKILKDTERISLSIMDSQNTNAVRPLNLYTSDNADTKVEELYSEFKSWPDEKTTCSIDAFKRIASTITAKNKNDRNRQLGRLNYLAYKAGTIDLKTYNNLEVLRDQDAIYAPVSLRRYFEIIRNAKDKLVLGEIERTSENDFSSKFAERKERLTERGRLYKNFDSTQIIILSQIIEKAAKRRDAQSVTLTFQYSSSPDDQENYVLSPMEKYRASIKMLRNDLATLMRSENFRGVALEYEDLISAAYETGLIKSDELDSILKFEELWNPKTPKWKAYTNFAFSLAGTASFYLPPPWNILGAVALVFTQTTFVNGKKPANPEESWNIIL